jgi:phosphomannomutase
MAGIFKAYDVRGIYPEQLNEGIARNIGLAFREVLDDEDRACGRTVVVSRDMRAHSPALAAALTEGLAAGGLDVLDIGLATTPMNYFAVGHLKTAAGIQVTASHNPARYNGLKFSRSDARPLAGEQGIPYLEELVRSGGLEPADIAGSVSTGAIFDAYENHLLSFVARPAGAPRLKVVVDCANGMGSLYRPILEQLGIELVPLYFELDGSFPNHEANPLDYKNLQDLCRTVGETAADLGVAFDGDADRAAMVDETG